MSAEIKHKRPKYTLDFKKDAAKLVIEKGYTHEQAANNLGISKSAIGRWVRTEQGPPKKTLGQPIRPNLDEHAEILKLRKEVEQLRMDREILKNRLPGAIQHPMQRNSLPLHCLGARTLAVCFLEVKIPVKKPGRWEAADPTVVALHVTPFRKVN